MLKGFFHDRQRINRLGREALWVLGGQALVVVGSLAGVRVLTEMMAPAQYGELALAMTVAIFLQQVFTVPLSSGFSRFYPVAREQGDVPGFFAAASSLFVKSLKILSLVVIPFLAVLFVMADNRWFFLLLVAIIYGILYSPVVFLMGLHAGARQRKAMALQQGVDSWGRFAFAALLMLIFGATGTVAILGYTLAALVALAIQKRFFFQRLFAPAAISPTISVEERERQMKNYALPIVLWGVFAWLQFSADRWALGGLRTTEEVGLYAALYQIGYYPIVLACGVVAQVLQPIFFGIAGDASDKLRMARVYAINRKMVYAALCLVIVCFVGAFFFHELVFRLFIADKYWRVSSLLPWMVLVGGLFSCGQTAWMGLLSGAESRSLLLPKIATALLCVICNYVGVLYFGIEGAIGAGVVFGGAYFIWMLGLLVYSGRKLQGTPLPAADGSRTITTTKREDKDDVHQRNGGTLLPL